MSKEIVKYHNQMNEISFGNFKEKELDLFFAICYKLKEIGKREVKLNFLELRNLIGETKNPKRLKNNIDSINKKLAIINHQIEIQPNVFERFVLFTNFTTDYNKNTLTIKVNKKFLYILNDLIDTYTKFDLLDFISLKSIYSKNVFKLLKQWESVKVKEFSIDDFRRLLGIPEKYSISDLNKRVLKPILNELPTYFCNFKMEKIKTGRKVTSIKFTWESKKEIGEKANKEMEILEISISDKLNKVIEKAKRNRYLTKLLNIDNIEKLLKSFEEKDLIKGLNFAYSEINQEIKSLNYLIKTIETGISKKEKKLVIEKPIEDKEIEDKEILEDDKVEKKEKIKITREEYELLYKIYLKENRISSNELANNQYVRKGFELSNKDKYEIIK